jgi:hypothetical protein
VDSDHPVDDRMHRQEQREDPGPGQRQPADVAPAVGRPDADRAEHADRLGRRDAQPLDEIGPVLPDEDLVVVVEAAGHHIEELPQADEVPDEDEYLDQADAEAVQVLRRYRHWCS